jgi:hypothetical protein
VKLDAMLRNSDTVIMPRSKRVVALLILASKMMYFKLFFLAISHGPYELWPSLIDNLQQSTSSYLKIHIQLELAGTSFQSCCTASFITART